MANELMRTGAAYAPFKHPGCGEGFAAGKSIEVRALVFPYPN